ncbi:hypothetical protein THASP1DRAFT_29554 [Thamnocephalis sphaerospora]|uniref:Kinesin motor domain-containing protein n=1 Tax=Thamnocephalis sphaerospora TaxID=78915 RepID=A0A4P9XRD8_9FUNG|nr:hypothetical protein THASP1DRAFT_29554 [Thamnocephalis sphaerospora]|eukprot:RKP08657.1 hypothetical protein THASP1DRAFT_29554 [Thamnocephalis sphaerospora]
MNVEYAKTYALLHLAQPGADNGNDSLPAALQRSADGAAVIVKAEGEGKEESLFAVDRCVDAADKQDNSLEQHVAKLVAELVKGTNASIYSMSVNYLGLTDTHCVNMTTGADVDVKRLRTDGIMRHYQKMRSCEALRALLQRGCSRPSLLTIRVEIYGESMATGYLHIVDMGTSHFHPSGALEQHDCMYPFTKTFQTFAKIVQFMASPSFTGHMPVEHSTLTELTVGIGYSTTFIMHFEASRFAMNSETVTALKFAEVARKIRCYVMRGKLDPRILRYKEGYINAHRDAQNVFKKMKEAKKDLETITAENAAQLEREEDNTKRWMSQVKALKAKIDAEARCTSIFNKRLEDERDMLRSRLQTLEIDSKVEMAGLETENALLHEEIRRISVQLSMMDYDKDELDIKATHHRRLAEKARKNAHDALLEQKALTSNTMLADNRIHELQQECATLQQKYESLLGQVHEKEAALAQQIERATVEAQSTLAVQEQVHQLRSELQKIREERDEALERVQDDSAVQLLQAKVDKFRSQLQEAVEHAADCQIELTRERGTFEAEKRRLQKELDEALAAQTSSAVSEEKPAPRAKKATRSRARTAKEPTEKQQTSSVDATNVAVEQAELEALSSAPENGPSTQTEADNVAPVAEQTVPTARASKRTKKKPAASSTRSRKRPTPSAPLVEEPAAAASTLETCEPAAPLTLADLGDTADPPADAGKKRRRLLGNRGMALTSSTYETTASEPPTGTVSTKMPGIRIGFTLGKKRPA